MSFNNIYTVYYTVDVDQKKQERNDDGNFVANMLSFVEKEVSNLYTSDSNREYLKSDDTTQVTSLLNSIIVENDVNKRNNLSEKIAKRLLKEEIAVQSRITQLKRDVQRGGLIISYFENDSEKFISIVKVQYIDFYEESTFKENRGLPKKDVILKTSITKVTTNSTDNKFYVSDSTKNKGEGSAKFWWDDFLELDEVLTNKDNTKESFEQIEDILKKEFYKNHREDYWTLKNNLIAYYRLTEQFSFNSMVESTLGNFDLKINESKTAKEVEELKKSLKTKFKKTQLDKNGNRRYDTEFIIDKKEVTAKVKTKITLMQNVDLNILGEVEDFHGKIIAKKDAQDKKYLQIYTDDGYDKFKN